MCMQIYQQINQQFTMGMQVHQGENQQSTMGKQIMGKMFANLHQAGMRVLISCSYINDKAFTYIHHLCVCKWCPL